MGYPHWFVEEFAKGFPFGAALAILLEDVWFGYTVPTHVREHPRCGGEVVAPEPPLRELLILVEFLPPG